MQAAVSNHPVTRTVLAIVDRVVVLVAGAAVCLVAALLVPAPFASLVLVAVALTLAILAALVGLVGLGHRRMQRRADRAVAGLAEHDAAPVFTTDAEGRIGFRNAAARQRFGSGSAALVATFGDLFASPASVLYQLQAKADAIGSAREDVLTRHGHLRLSVHQIAGGGFLWRLEEMLYRSAGLRGGDGVALPMLTATADGAVLSMNEAMLRLVGVRQKSLDRLFSRLPLVSGEDVEVAGADGPVRAIVADLAGPDTREIYLLPCPPTDDLTAPDAVFEELPVALLRLTSGGRVLAANRLARGLVNHPCTGEVRLSDLVEGLGRPVADWLGDAAASRATPRPEILRATLPEFEQYLQVTLRRVVTRGRTGLIAVLNDATELKTLEAQFVQSQKMQAIGQLAGGVAHDFNNLLTAISGYCDLLLLRHDQGDPEYADLVQIRENTNRAASLVRQLLAFSRKQTLQPEVIDLRDALADVIHLLNRLVGEKVTLTLSHHHDLRPIRADKRQFEQVLMNLVVNARDAMPQGGRIRIETDIRRLDEALNRDRAIVPQGDFVVIRVCDEGVGIPADKLTKIFEPFYTTKRTGEGTGLGLSTAYGIVKQTGGFIFVDSVPGSGTTFTLYFPAHDPVAEPAETARIPVAVRPVLRHGAGVILLVEDEAPVRAFAARALRMRGYTVLEAENAEDALTLLGDAAIAIDVFVSDVIMPGMDGPTWVQEALKSRPGVRVVFISGYAEESFTETQARIPNSVFLPKPFSLAELTATVQEQIG